MKAIAALNSVPLLLDTTKANVKKLADFGPQDRIAVPAVKVTTKPENVLKIVEFMKETGMLSTAPAQAAYLFFPTVQAADGK